MQPDLMKVCFALVKQLVSCFFPLLRACLREGGGSQVGEIINIWQVTQPNI